MEKLILFSGAGMSAESGLKTFRDNGGLWENYKVSEVATPEAWQRNPQLVLDFYNQRRQQLLKAKPNEAHILINELEKYYDVTVITQNIDNLHEQAGSSKVIHLHGELMKAKCSYCNHFVKQLDQVFLNIGDYCEKGHQLRPDVVWFGEAVPLIPLASQIMSKADYLVVIGTSLNVYPAAALVHDVSDKCQKFLIDPNANELNPGNDWKILNCTAEQGMHILYERIKKGDLRRL